MGERVIIMGGGVIGLSCAFEALMKGYKVTVVEARTCGGQASGAAAGMLAPFSENTAFPDDFFRLCRESLRLYPEWQQAVKDMSGEDFEYTNSGSLYAVYHEADLSALKQRQLWQNEFGAQAEIVEGGQLRRLEPELSPEVIAALYIPVESHVHAPDYVKALERACRRLGAEIYEQAGHAKPELTPQGIRVISEHGEIYEGDRLIVCTGAWSKMWEAQFGIAIPVFPIRGQICAYDTAPQRVRHMVFTSQGYLVSKRHGQLVCGASEDLAGFDTSVTEKGIARLLTWNDKVFPFVSALEPVLKWAGLRPATQDGYPLIGELPQDRRVIIACGHYRNGILLSPVTAKIVGGLLTGQASRLSLAAFAPERFSSGLQYMKEA
ncbi:glycine oxidase ThiO [Insulibacter thermoxylanivorax]|uniref:glycine oxidase n=1 Tax=Insulibacter thermoxylanivorax TaxID=2749268 RepID=A0A916QBF2_9BACL|nr:glycine oxidase ThiO [Insulibacter thermoxylanivorax]GFR37545.1 glycine oxidase ThiO [Insulibacter thermoxylanivorax]